MARLNISLSEENKEDFQRITEEVDLNSSSVVESLIETWLEKMEDTDHHHKKILEEMNDLNL